MKDSDAFEQQIRRIYELIAAGQRFKSARRFHPFKYLQATSLHPQFIVT